MVFKGMTAVLAGAAVAVGALAGCSGGDTTQTSTSSSASSASVSAGASESSAGESSESAATHNDADEMYVLMMVPHHEQAIEMADLVPSHTDNAELTTLAAAIKAAQQPEIDQMTGWLKDWGLTPMTMAEAHMHDMGSTGMMSEADMAKLEGLSGAAFDKAWLQLMIAHHQGAIVMSNSLFEDGVDPQVQHLAEGIVTTQQEEITQMESMLAG